MIRVISRIVLALVGAVCMVLGLRQVKKNREKLEEEHQRDLRIKLDEARWEYADKIADKTEAIIVSGGQIEDLKNQIAKKDEAIKKLKAVPVVKPAKAGKTRKAASREVAKK